MDAVLYNELKKTRAAIDVKLTELDTKLTALQNTQAASLSKINDTYLVCKDLLTGQQISDWVADLKAYGTSSETYANTSRMTALVNSSDAVGDSVVTKTLRDWSIDSGLIGTYCGTLTGDTSVSWSSLTTLDALVGSEDAFCGVLANDDNAWDIFKDVSAFRTAIKNNGLSVESWFTEYPELLTRLQKMCSLTKISDYTTWKDTVFLYYSYGSKSPSASSGFVIKYLDGTQVGGSGSSALTTTHNKFVAYAYWSYAGSSSSVYGYLF